ncbi:MAG: YkgJ family cysteine cluster protein [Gemmataceae bacterium]|nr:YkgJ family cysteine cluster protein [Gemmataceae bacterium]
MIRTPLPVVSCDDCGACCTEQAALPTSLVGTAFRMPGVGPLPVELRAELLAAVERFRRDGWPADGTPCIWYDAAAKRCRHYEYRPTLCRDEVVPGDEACRRWRRLKGVGPRPPRYAMRNGRVVKV